MSISANCVYKTPQPSQSMVRIRSIFPVRHLTAKANMMCFGGLVLPAVTAVGELFNSVAENSQSSLSALFAET